MEVIENKNALEDPGFQAHPLFSRCFRCFQVSNRCRYVETSRMDSWAEHERQHDRFTVADRECEDRVLRFTVEPIKTRHFLYADRIE